MHNKSKYVWNNSGCESLGLGAESGKYMLSIKLPLAGHSHVQHGVISEFLRGRLEPKTREIPEDDLRSFILFKKKPGTAIEGRYASCVPVELRLKVASPGLLCHFESFWPPLKVQFLQLVYYFVFSSCICPWRPRVYKLRALSLNITTVCADAEPVKHSKSYRV